MTHPDCEGAHPASPSAERILTQARDAQIEACAKEIAYEASYVNKQLRHKEAEAILRRHFPARSGAAVVMPESPVQHTKFGGIPMEGEPHIEWVRGFQACLAEFARLNPAPSTASASESEEK